MCTLSEHNNENNRLNCVVKSIIFFHLVAEAVSTGLSATEHLTESAKG